MSMSKAYLGVDVGSRGCIACQCDGKWEWYYICEMDYYQIANVFRTLREKNEEIACVIEDVRAIHGSASTATFAFGENKGFLIGMLCAFNIPYTLVLPKKWQSIWEASDKEYDSKRVQDKKGEWVTKLAINTKRTSINAAKRLFPTIDFRRNNRCKNIDDNKVDATLMSEYARRKNL